MMRRRNWVGTGIAALAGGGALALLGPTSPAVAFFSPPLLLEVQVGATGTLVAGGAAVDVPLNVTCAGTDQAFVAVSLTERVGSALAQGTGGTDIGCTGSNQPLTMRVYPTGRGSPGKAFKKGTAVADATVSGQALDPNTGQIITGSERDQRTISITH